MTNKPKYISDFASMRGPKPVAMVNKFQKPDIQFPSVGMTLSSYSRNVSIKDSVSKTPVFRVAKPNRVKRFFRFSWKKLFLTVVFVILVVGGWVGGKFVYNTNKVFGGGVFSVLRSSKLQGEDVGRINILIAGNSSDDNGHEGAELTDSIMIASVDTVNNKAFLLSVPRDLWVNISGYGHAKINSAFVYGKNDGFNEAGLPEGGMGLLQKVIQNNFGITINYFGLIDYTALRQAVDAVGGIDITIATSDKRGLYDPSIDWTTNGPLVKLTNGVHRLDGRQALNLARARGDAYNSYGFDNADFDRTENQRQMLVALKSKAISASVISNPANLIKLSDAIGGNIKSNMTLSEVKRLYDLTKNISNNSIQSLSLIDANGKNLLSNYTTEVGSSALIPSAGYDVFDDIQSFIVQHTSPNPVVQESATVVLLNATDTSGLATGAKSMLTNKNFIIGAIGDASSNQAVTSIIDISGGRMPSTKAALSQIYGNNFLTVNSYSEIYIADFIVLLGGDQIPKPTATTPSQ